MIDKESEALLQEFREIKTQLQEYKDDTDQQMQFFFDDYKASIKRTQKRYRIIFAGMLVLLFATLYNTSFMYSIENYAMRTTEHITNLYANLMHMSLALQSK